MATIYKVESKSYLQELIDYLTKKNCRWLGMVYDNNSDMIDYVWELYENDLGMRVTEDNIMCDGIFSIMVEKSSDTDKVIEEDFRLSKGEDNS